MLDDSAIHDPRCLLDTEARIIAENDRYCVLAIRLDKRWLAKNTALLALLAALADSADRLPIDRMFAL